MKDIVIIRHGKSSWKHDCDDIMRPLNSRGIWQSNRAPEFYSAFLPIPDGIISSPAVRAYHTAQAFHHYYNSNSRTVKLIVNSCLYFESLESVVEIITDIPDQYDNVFLVFHNPMIEALATYLTDSHIHSIKTCHAVHIRLNIESWSEATKGCGIFVEHLVPPKQQFL